jgi:hypothetical protein
MADDRMKNDDLNPDGGKQAGQMGKQAGQMGNQPGQQSPGRHSQDDEKFGQKSGGQGTTGNRGLEDDELGQGGRDKNIGEQGDQNR